MKISVITIAWNDLGGVRRTVESTRSQTHVDIEHIVIDGGSTDGTSAYLEGLDTRTRWVSEKDNGRYDAMNKGARMATGDLVWFMHSSDVFHAPESAAIVAAKYSAERFKWGFGLSQIVDQGSAIGVGGRIPFDHSRFLIGGRPIPHQATVFDRSFFWKLGGYDVSFGLTSDQLFMMRASMVAPPEVWAEILCDFDASGAGSTRGAWAHYRDMTRARRHESITLSGSELTDRLLSGAFAVGTMASRVQRRAMRKLRPRVENRK